MKRLIPLMLVMACGGGGEQDLPADSLPGDAVVAETLPLEMPDAPSASRGQVAVRTVGAMDLNGAWNGRVGVCVSPPMAQILVQEQLDGVLLLLALPDSGSRTTTYPVVNVETGLPEGPAAQAAVQRIIEDRPHGWQAESGEVEIYAWDAGRMSGRFRLTMRDLATNERSNMAGAFLGLEVIELPAGQCDTSAPPADG